MNNALTTIEAAASTRLCGRLAFVRALVLGCAVACAGAPAFAQDRGEGRRNGASQQAPPVQRDQPRPERMAQPPQRSDPRQFDQHAFDARAEEQRRQAAQQQEQGRRAGRLTPDERRELRRQINEAGIDLYPNTPRR